MVVRVKRLDHARGLALPEYQTSGSAGMDLLAAVPDDAPLALNPGDRIAVPTGLCLEIPLNCEAQVRPRSGLALNHGITCLNAPGTIDSDYRGEVKVILIHHGDEPMSISRGMRIAQIVFVPILSVEMEDTPELTRTTRSIGGFGSTGQGG
ncbi:MAG: dUTP diphosphatase [Pseudomonadota bacterium]